MTQIVFDLDALDRFAEIARRLAGAGARRDLPAHELPARAAPPQRGAGDHRAGGAAGALDAAGPDAAEVGMAHAQGPARSRARSGATGVYVVAPFRKPTSVLELLS